MTYRPFSLSSPRGILLITACWFAFHSAAFAAESIVYAVTTGQPGRFPRIAKTEIFALSPRGDQPRRVFSDAGMTFLLVTSGERVMASTGVRIFAPGYDRKSYRSGLPTYPAAIYELSTDGSNRARKLFDLEGDGGTSNYRDLFVSPSGAKLGHINSVEGKWFLFIHDTASGKLLLKMGLTPIALDCFVRTVGWMRDGKRLFFTLETGDVHVTSDPSYARAGSYLMPDAGGPPTTFLYTVQPSAGARRDFLVGTNIRVGSARLSPLGDMVVFTVSAGERRVGTELLENRTVRVLDMVSGEQQTVFSFTANLLNLPATELIGWIDAK